MDHEHEIYMLTWRFKEIQLILCCLQSEPLKRRIGRGKFCQDVQTLEAFIRLWIVNIFLNSIRRPNESNFSLLKWMDRIPFRLNLRDCFSSVFFKVGPKFGFFSSHFSPTETNKRCNKLSWKEMSIRSFFSTKHWAVTSFFKVTWIVSPNGCHQEAFSKVTFMGPSTRSRLESNLPEWFLWFESCNFHHSTRAVTKGPWLFKLFMGDEILPSYIGIIQKPWNKDPHKPTGIYLDLPFVCKICAKIHPKNLPNGRILTYLEDSGISNEMSQGFWSLLTIQDLRGVAVQSTNPGSEYETSPGRGKFTKRWQFQYGSMVVVVGWTKSFGWGILLTLHCSFLPVFFLGSHGELEHESFLDNFLCGVIKLKHECLKLMFRVPNIYVNIILTNWPIQPHLSRRGYVFKFSFRTSRCEVGPY